MNKSVVYFILAGSEWLRICSVCFWHLLHQTRCMWHKQCVVNEYLNLPTIWTYRHARRQRYVTFCGARHTCVHFLISWLFSLLFARFSVFNCSLLEALALIYTNILKKRFVNDDVKLQLECVNPVNKYQLQFNSFQFWWKRNENNRNSLQMSKGHNIYLLLIWIKFLRQLNLSLLCR